jgi:ribosome-associated translation inhibitor RaiA
MQQMQEVQAGFQTQLGKLTDATLTVTGLMGQVLQAQAKTEERFAKIDERFQALEQKLSQTDDRLNVLIDIVERYITGRNGKSEG